jgi:hypothetical protein
MKRTAGRWSAALVSVFAAIALSACVAAGYSDGGTGVDVGVGYAGGFYEPWGYDYGGWGGGYRVGPPRGGDHFGGARGRPGRGAPSIPRGPRGGASGHRR